MLMLYQDRQDSQFMLVVRRIQYNRAQFVWQLNARNLIYWISSIMQFYMRHFQPHWRTCKEHFIWCETFWLPSVDRTWPPLVSQCPAPWTIKSFHSCKQLVKEGVLAIKSNQVEQKEKDWSLAFQRSDKDFNVVDWNHHHPHHCRHAHPRSWLYFRDVRAIPLISASRWLVKRGECQRLSWKVCSISAS